MPYRIPYLLSLFILVLIGFTSTISAQPKLFVKGMVVNAVTGEPVSYAVLEIKGRQPVVADNSGHFHLSRGSDSSVQVILSAVGYFNDTFLVDLFRKQLLLQMNPLNKSLEEVVVSGTLKTVNRLSSPIPVESYPSRFFKKNVTSNLFEALGMVNGVQPQINCNVCNTGALQINGLDGPYTMVLIDGMPVVSSLSSVYGFMGIPNSIIKRVEVVKGPASTLYGTEAVAGLINIITKEPANKNQLQLEQTVTSYAELNTDLSANLRLKKASVLMGVNRFSMQRKWDVNTDQFTDITLQNRYSFFNKWNFKRQNQLAATVALRYVWEDRNGGELKWEQKFRGSDSVYGESIVTNRFELLGFYEIPIGTEKLVSEYSWNSHLQQSWYGKNIFDARQYTGFVQLRWNKKIGVHELLMGLPFRYIKYDDNTPATFDGSSHVNKPSLSINAGMFIQDEWRFHPKWLLLSGLRTEYNNKHGLIFSPRLSVKYDLQENHVFRFTVGNGYRVVNLFTEDHAALTGAREVVIKNKLKPEKSWNANLNYSSHYHVADGLLSLDINGFYTYFMNRIVADYFTNSNQIIYDNLEGYAVSSGVSFTADWNVDNKWRVNAGATLMDVFLMRNGVKEKQVSAPGFTSNYSVGYTVQAIRLTIDFTGKTVGPMRMPVLQNDYRPEFSPWYSLLNLQLIKKLGTKIEVMAGVKNILNFLPRDPIMRPFDPFDKTVNDPVTNPYGYTFDPSYNYAPMMGRRWAAGIKLSIE